MPGCSFNARSYAAAALWLEGTKVEYGENPKRKDTKSYDRYEAYSKASTIGEALEFGSLPDDLLFDFEKGHLKVSEPLRQAPLDLFTVKDFDQLTLTDKTLAKYAAAGTAKDGEENPDQKLFVSKLDEALRKHKSNMRRLVKIEKAKKLDVDVDMLADDTGAYENETMAARRTIANQQAEDMLEAIQAEGRKVTDYEILEALRLWDFRENTARGNVMKEGQSFVYSDTVGLVANYVGGVVVKEECRRYPAFANLLNRWLKDNLPSNLGADFVYTSININKNYAGKLHRDGNNMGPSFLKAFGDFKGGDLNYYPEDDKSITLDVIQEKHAKKNVQLDVSKGLLLFDGKRGHFVNDFEGERYSLVFFTCPRFERIREEGKAYMDAAGFPFPTEESIDKLATVLRKPRGYQGSSGPKDTSCIHDAPFLFYPHACPERDDNEARAEQYWKEKGVRSRLECQPEDKAVSRRYGKKEGQWYKGCSFVLPGKPTREELILKSHDNMVDAFELLNKPDSKAPQFILDAGYCAVFAKKFKKWHVLFKYGCKDQALEAFGLQPAVADEGSEDEEKEARTPPQKRKATESDTIASSQKHCKPDETAKSSDVGSSAKSSFFSKKPREAGEKTAACMSKAAEKPVDSSSAETPAALSKAKGKGKAPKGKRKEPPSETPVAPAEAKEAEPAASKAEPMEVDLVAGARVQCHGLKSVQYNGLNGVLQQFEEKIGRWSVRLDNGEQHNFKPENLKEVKAETREDAKEKAEGCEDLVKVEKKKGGRPQKVVSKEVVEPEQDKQVKDETPAQQKEETPAQTKDETPNQKKEETPTQKKQAALLALRAFAKKQRTESAASVKAKDMPSSFKV